MAIALDLVAWNAHGDVRRIQSRREFRFHAEAAVTAPAEIQAGVMVEVGLGDGEGRGADAGGADQRQFDQVVRAYQ